jgi:hypothetical protein
MGRRLGALVRAAVGLAVWAALPVLGVLALRGVGDGVRPGAWLDPLVPIDRRVVAVAAMALLACWAAATALVVLGPAVRATARRARRRAARPTRDAASGWWVARGWVLAVILGGAVLATRPSVAAAAAPMAAELDATSDADRARAPVGALSVLTCGLVAAAVLTRVHRGRLRAGVAQTPSTIAVPVTPLPATRPPAMPPPATPSPSALERSLRRHAVHSDSADQGPRVVAHERNPWTAVPIGLGPEGIVTVDLARGGCILLVPAEASSHHPSHDASDGGSASPRDVVAGLVTALAGACGFDCTARASDDLRDLPSLVPLGPLEAPGSAVRVARRDAGPSVEVVLGTALAAVPHTRSAASAPAPPILTLECAGPSWRCLELGVELRPYRLSASDAAGIARLEAVRPTRHSPHAWSPPDAWQVLVRTMGPVTVELADGREVGFARPKSVELLAWLTHHRDRPTRMAARTALWAADVSDATVSNVVSDARRSLARAVGGDEAHDWIARTYTERLGVDPRIVADVDVLTAAHRASLRDPTADSVARVDQALAWVRDLPFAGSDYLWPDEEGLTSHAVHLIVSAARHSAEWHLEAGDADAVVAATGAGLRALRGDEDLLALRARATQCRGARRPLAAR